VNEATVRNFLSNINPDVAGTIKTKRHVSKTSPDDMLTGGDIEALINAAPTNRDRALIACLFDSGARKGELLSTTIQDAKFDENGCILWLREGKTGPRPARLIYAASFLREWLNVHPAIPVLNKNTCERLFNISIFRNDFVALSTFTEYES
jgi:integrase/recombinase XerD